MTIQNLRHFKLPGLAALCLALAACAGQGGGKSATQIEVPVEERARQHWEHKVKGEFEQAYEFLSAGEKSLNSKEMYVEAMKDRPVRWTQSEVIGSKCEEGTPVCQVTVKVNYTLLNVLTGVKKVDTVSAVTEKWIRSNGVWYLTKDHR